MKQLAIFLLVAFLATAAYSANKKSTPSKAKNPQTILTGYLVDVHCAKKMMQKEDAAMPARQHERSCDMMPECEASGYGVFVVVNKTKTHSADVDFYKFDAAGNKLAKDFLANSTNKDNMLVTVSGKGTLAVEKIEPAQ